MDYLDLKKLKTVYNKGKNITQYLRKNFNQKNNTSEIIEIAYDLQAGSYIEKLKLNAEKKRLYINEISQILNQNIAKNQSLLDIGTGELTTLVQVLNKIKKPLKIFAFDISWSRLYRGKKYFEKNIKNKKIKPLIFCADIKFIPLKSKSIDVIISNHALEPNGKNLPDLLKELFRVARKKVVLFEPSYELNSAKGKKRMDKLGYIKNVSLAVKNLGGHLVDKIPIKNVTNKLNSTACYIIQPPKKLYKTKTNKNIFCVPGSNFPLKKTGEFYISKKIGLAYPIFKKIPIFKNNSSILISGNF